MPVIVMEQARGLHSEPTGFLFAKCRKTRRVKCIGVKSYVQRHREIGGLTVIHPGGKISHYFGEDAKPIFGFNEIA